ncbi:DUF2575 domain-containing protein [Escherichia coli]|nr:DUF2575 domain-containing protein [Escherichia coli]
MCRHSLRSDGAGFYQLAGVNTAFREKNCSRRSVSFHDLRHSNESHFFLISVLNRRLTLTAVQGILGRFSLF